MDLTLVRHATLVVEFCGRRLLIDPMLDPSGARPAVPDTPNPRANPLVELPSSVDELVGGFDAVLVTHTHEDHFDDTAARRLPRDLPLLCQPTDEETFIGHGFTDVEALAERTSLDWLTVTRTDGRHGRGELAESLGPVSGFVLAADDVEPTLYVAGDTIWCQEVEAALDAHRPDVVVVNAGAARFIEGAPITMTTADVLATVEHAPSAQVIAVHMDAVNHCLLSRAELRERLGTSDAAGRVTVPDDGEHLSF